MATNTPDYRMLVELRKHLVVVAEATKQLTSAKTRTQELENTLREVKYTNKHVGKEPEYSAHENAARRQYQYQCEKKTRDINDQREDNYNKKKKGTKLRVTSWLTLATFVGCLGLIGLFALLWIKTKLGYDFFMDRLWEGIVPQWNGSLHIYCYVLGVAIAFSLAMLILYSFQSFDGISDICGFIASIIPCLAILFSFVVGFVFIAEWWNVQGGWWALAWIPAILAGGVILPIVFIAKILFATLVSFVVFAILLVIPVILMFMWNSLDSICARLNPKMAQVRVTMNEQEFRNTEEYRKAVERDKVEDPVKRREYLEKVGIIRQGLVAQYTALISAENSVILMLENAIKKSKVAIAECPINIAYKTIPNVSWLLYYFEMGMADTFKEAANLMREDLNMQSLMKVIQRGFSGVMKGLESIQVSLNGLTQATHALANQWNAFAKQSELQHREIMGSMKRMEDQQDRVARYTRQAIQDAEKSMTKSLGELKSTYVTSSNNAADRIAGEISSASDSVTNMLRILAY